MTTERTAKRYPAAAFPGITGVRLAPLDAGATLVNISETGALIECAGRPPVGGTVHLQLAGTFIPGSIQARVVRCEVAGIAADGSLHYQLGLAFLERIVLPADVGGAGDASAPEPADPVIFAASAALVAGPPITPVLRNRW